MESRIIGDVQSLAGLADAWRSLQPSISHPFQELGWYTAWARTIGATGGRRLKVVTLWDGGRLVAVLPLVLRRFKGVRLLEWVGARVTDYCDVIIDRTVDSSEAMHLLWRELQRHVRFDVLRLSQVRADAIISPFLERLNPWIETHEDAFGILVNWNSAEDWMASRGGSSRQRIRRQLRQMDKDGYKFKLWQASEPLEPILEAAIEQKRAWVGDRDVKSFITDEQGPEFLRSVAREMAARGFLHMSAVQWGDRYIACHVGFQRDGVFYYYMPTYDAAFAKQSPGRTLLEYLIMSAGDHGVKKFDLLLGAEDYKKSYNAVAESVRTLVLPRGLIGRAAVAYYRASAQRLAARNSGEGPAEQA